MRGIKLGFVEHPAGDMMLVDFWVKFQDEKLASPSFGQSKWAGHESKYWNWTNCATLKLAGLFFSIKPAIVFKLSRISVQNVIQKFRLCNFLWQTPSVLWCEVVWLKATPPPPEDFVRCIERILRLYGEIDALCRRAQNIGFLRGFLLFFLFASKDSHWFRHCKQAETLSIQYT